MKKLAKAVVLALAVVVILVLLGCAAMQEAVTPCHIDSRMGAYTGEPMTSYMPYTTIADAKRLKEFMAYKSETRQIDFMRLSEDDIRYVDLMQKVQRGHLRRAAALKDTLFSPTGPGSILLGMIPALGIGAFAISKPGDKKQIKELEKKTV